MAERTIHASVVRLYEVAAKQREPKKDKPAVADWLGVSYQTLHNWESRGISRDGALEAEKKSGYSAVWIMSGMGEPLATADSVYMRLREGEGDLLLLYRDLDPEQQAEVVQLANKLHNKKFPGKSPANPFPNASKPKRAKETS